MKLSRLSEWVRQHPARAGTLAGWYQQASGALTALVAVPLVIKHLSEVDAGLWFSFQAILAVITLTDFGLSFVASRQIAFSLKAAGGATDGSDFIRTRAGWLGVSDVYAAGRRMFRWVALGALLVLVLLYEVVLPQGKLLATATRETAAAWYLMGGAMLLSLQVKPHQALLDGLARLYLTRFVAGTYQLAAGFGAVIVLLLGGRLVSMAGVLCAASVAHYLVFRWLVRQQAGAHLAKVDQLPEGMLRQFVRVATPMGVLNLSAFCVSSVQVPLLGMLLGPELVPAFYLAQRIGQMLNQGVLQLVFPQLPLFTHELAAGDAGRARERMVRNIRRVTGLVVLANAFYFFASPLFVELWVGPSRYVSQSVLLLMSLDYLVLGSATVWAQFVLAAGQNPFLYSTLISGVLNIGLFCLSIPAAGLVGIPLASLAAGAATNYWLGPLKGVRLLVALRSAGVRSGSMAVP